MNSSVTALLASPHVFWSATLRLAWTPASAATMSLALMAVNATGGPSHAVLASLHACAAAQGADKPLMPQSECRWSEREQRTPLQDADPGETVLVGVRGADVNLAAARPLALTANGDCANVSVDALSLALRIVQPAA